MKKTLRLSCMALMVLGAMACNKGNVRLNNGTSSDDATDQAASLITGALSSSTDGAFNAMSEISIETQAHVSIDSLCGTTWTDSATTKKAATNTTAGYNYSAKYTYTLNCDSVTKNGIYNGSATATSEYSGSYSAPNLSSTNTGSSLLVIQGLGHGSTYYTLNGEYKSSGTYTSKTDTGTNSIDLKLANIELTKPFKFIKSGSASITVSGMSSKNGSFSYDGVLQFNNGNNTATLTLNGTIYTVDLVAGTYSRR